MINESVLNIRNKTIYILDYLGGVFSSFPLSLKIFFTVSTILIFILPGFYSLPPLDRDEARFAQASRQMLESGDYITIKFQEELRSKKPIGIYWIQSFSAKIFGKDKIFSYRIPNILASLMICILMGCFSFSLLYYYTSHALPISYSLAILSSLLLFSTTGFSIEIRQAKTDTFLLLICLLQQWLILKIYTYGKFEWNLYEKNRISWFSRFFWVVLSIGILIKGPISPLLAFSTIFCLISLDRVVEKKWDLSWLSIFLWIQGAFIISIIVLPWVFLAWQKTDGALIIDALNQDFFSKIISGQENHGAPPGSHSLALLFTFWPCAILLPFAGRACLDWSHQYIIRFLISWIVPFWLIMEIIPTKLPHYILPTFPALIMLILIGLSSPASGKSLLKFCGRIFQLLAGLATVLLFIIFICISIYFSSKYFHFFLGLGIGVFSIISFLMGFIFILNYCKYKLVPLFCMAFFAGISYSLFLGLLVPNLDKIHLSSNISTYIKSLNPRPEVIVASGYHEPSLVFLLGKDTMLITANEAAMVLAEGGNVIAIIEDKEKISFENSLKQLNEKFKEIERISGYNLAKGEKTSIGIYKRIN